MRTLVSSGSPYEATVGFSRAVRAGAVVSVAGTAPIDRDWLVEIEADAVVDDEPHAVLR